MANASLGGVALDENPRRYEESLASRRHSVYRTYDGSTVVQNFGVRAGDRILRVECDYVTAAKRTALEGKHTGAQPVAWISPDEAAKDTPTPVNVIVLSMTFERWRGHELYRVVFTMQVVP